MERLYKVNNFIIYTSKLFVLLCKKTVGVMS